jgi:hypothetical protein
VVLASLINHPERLNRDTLYELRSIVARYPYFQTARLLMLSNMYLLHESDFGAELRRSVLYVNDRRVLCRLIEGYTDRVVPGEEMHVEEPTADRTMSLIDAFLNTLPEGHADVQELAIDVVGDYAARYLVADGKDTDELEKIEVANGMDHTKKDENTQRTTTSEDLNFSEYSELLTPNSPVADGADEYVSPESTELLDEGSFTETLAKIYIKQHKYSRALEIIKSLYLQFPEKNTYFADQIRFLEKLIINNNLK